jgi:hypothetical protein
MRTWRERRRRRRSDGRSGSGSSDTGRRRSGREELFERGRGEDASARHEAASEE